MSKDKETKTIQEMLKQFFKINKGNLLNTAPFKEFVLTPELIKDLGKDSTTATRVRIMKEMTEQGVLSRLETNGVEKLWTCVQDMFLKEFSNDVRHATFNFLQCLIKNQFEKIYVMRAQFFRFIKHHDNPHDLAQRVDLLGVLTHNGKELEHFEEEIGPFLLTWIDEVHRVGKLHEFLIIMDNVIKFNSPYLDETIMTSYVKHICALCCSSDQYPIVILALQILGTVVAYSYLPNESLPQFVGTLCRTVNVRCYCQASWKTMKNLLGTHLGHSTLFTMCRFLQEPNLKHDSGLMRGCVFYIHMALWDMNSMQNLCCPPSSVLPSLLQAVRCNHPSVAYEAILGVQKLTTKHGFELLEPTWDIVLQMLMHILRETERAPNEVPNNVTVGVLHETLNTIENLIEVGSYKGSVKGYFNVVKECARDRPEASVLKLISYVTKSVRPTEHGWLQNVYNLLAGYFRSDMRTNVRLKCLSVLSDAIQLHGQYEDELINHIVISHLQCIHNDHDIIIRQEAVKLLVNLCMDSNNNLCMDLLESLEKLLMRPYEKSSSDNFPHTEADFFDVLALVPGLIQVFARKIHKLPSAHAIKIHTIFVNFLERHFKSDIFKKYNKIRYMILDCLLKMRADSLYRLGFPDPTTGKLRYSSYLCVSYRQVDAIQVTPPVNSNISKVSASKLSFICLENMFRVFLLYLEKEKDWEVLKLILDNLPKMLENKAIILSKNGNTLLNDLVEQLCTMLQSKTMTVTESLNVKVTRLDFQTAIVKVMIGLSSYGSNLEQTQQRYLIDTLSKTTGTDPRCSRQTINALTICMVDMRETMVKVLPDVLLRLSKISATKYIATSVLEFLSTLSQLPTVYSNFVSDQYMAVFAIALPYTNPFRYETDIVSLAYHVISVWFLKCRLTFRKDFVKFIVSGLQTNVMVPFQELNQFKTLSSMNQDSSDRKRSSSLTEPSSRRRAQKSDANKQSGFMQKNAASRDQTVLTFYEELNETCIDLMARYTFSPCSALPTRLPTAEFLLNGGIAKSWMVGNKLITVTTSGCTEKVLKQGVCDKCWGVCGSVNSAKIARYARSNSGTDEKEGFLLSRQGSSSDKSDDGKKVEGGAPKIGSEQHKEPPICACWCQGWAEILIRRPTGNVSWVMKMQNQVSFKQILMEFPLNEMAALYMPDLFFEPSSALSIEEKEEESEEACGPPVRPVSSVPGSPNKPSLSRQSSRDSADDELEFVYDDGTKSRNPVRRSNSSPEMGNWKNPFVHQRPDEDIDEDSTKKSKKDVRVSCEAIPEEMSGMGTSSPTGEQETQKTHTTPSLVTCHSYPGSSPPKESAIAKKPYQTVPASPNQIAVTNPPAFPEKALERPNNLPNLTNLAPLSSKPPQSPTQTSPRFQRHDKEREVLAIQKSSSSSKVERVQKPILEASLAEKRDRLNTISVMSTRKSSPPTKKVLKEIVKSGLNPSFIFLQLFHSACFGSTSEVPLLVHSTPVIDRAINILDRMYPYETHKVGVLYIGEGQVEKESEILRNTSGSVRYMEFLKNLGTLIRLADVNPHQTFLGGVNQSGADGTYLYTHQDDLVMLAFHVATLMPNKDSDPSGYSKKAHIGNDNVVIVYNNSGEIFDINNFKSQVTLAYVIVEPLDYNCNKIEIKVKSELKINGVNEVVIVSDQSLSIFVRQLAVHADLAATILNSQRSHSTDPYGSNWLQRLRQLKNLREKVTQETKKRTDAQKGFGEGKNTVEDFTDFT